MKNSSRIWRKFICKKLTLKALKLAKWPKWNQLTREQTTSLKIEFVTMWQCDKQALFGRGCPNRAFTQEKWWSVTFGTIGTNKMSALFARSSRFPFGGGRPLSTPRCSRRAWRLGWHGPSSEVAPGTPFWASYWRPWARGGPSSISRALWCALSVLRSGPRHTAASADPATSRWELEGHQP